MTAAHESYTAWLASEIQTAIDDPWPSVLHDEVMARTHRQRDRTRDQRYDNYQQVVGAFSQSAGNQHAGVQLAAGPGYSGMGSGSSDRDQNITRMLDLANSSPEFDSSRHQTPPMVFQNNGLRAIFEFLVVARCLGK